MNHSQQQHQKPSKGFQMPPEPANIAAGTEQMAIKQPTAHPSYPMNPKMVSAIKNSRKGKVPAGLAKWLATHKKGGK